LCSDSDEVGLRERFLAKVQLKSRKEPRAEKKSYRDDKIGKAATKLVRIAWCFYPISYAATAKYTKIRETKGLSSLFQIRGE